MKFRVKQSRDTRGSFCAVIESTKGGILVLSAAPIWFGRGGVAAVLKINAEHESEYCLSVVRATSFL